jgi:DNA-binding SARP family transcriptional activator
VAELLGPVRLAVGDRAIPDDAWPRRSARALLLLLLATPGHRLPRDRVLDLLWPEAAPPAARNAFYKALHALRRVLEPGLAAGAESAYLQVGAEAVGLRPEVPLRLDVDAFEERLAAAAALAPDARRPPLREALLFYRDDLLAAEPALDWTVARREALRRRRHRAALDLAELELAADAPAAALPPLEALLAADAADEAALRLLMRALAALGRRDEALRRYEQGRAALHGELGIEPDAATGDLAASLRASVAAQARPALPPSAPAPRRWEEVPAPPSPLVGRARELERAQDLLWRPGVRLVTLTGPGGVGKTRLALEVATAMLGELEQGACFVDLAPLRDPGLVLPTVARALGLDEEPGQTALATLRRALRAAELLLVLDNCEQVLAAAPAIAELLAGCRRLRCWRRAASRSASAPSTNCRCRRWASRRPDARAGRPAPPTWPATRRPPSSSSGPRRRPGRRPRRGRGGRDRRDLRPPRRPAPGDRAGRRPQPRAPPVGPPRPPRPPPAGAGRRLPRPAGPPADAARRHRLEPRAADGGRAAALPAPRRLRRSLQPESGRGGLRRAGRLGEGPLARREEPRAVGP